MIIKELLEVTESNKSASKKMSRDEFIRKAKSLGGQVFNIEDKRWLIASKLSANLTAGETVGRWDEQTGRAELVSK